MSQYESTLRRPWLWIFAVVAIVGVFAAAGFVPQLSTVAAQDEAPDENAETSDAEGADPYEVRDGTPEELIAQLEKLDALRSEIESVDDLIKTETAVTGVVQKILAADVSDAIRDQAVLAQFESYKMMLQYARSQDGLLDAVTKFSGEYLDSENEEIAEGARTTNLIARTYGFADADEETRAAFVDEIVEQLKTMPNDKMLASVANAVARATQQSASAEEAAATYTLFGDAMIEGGNTAQGEAMLGSARRLGLLGNPMEVFGTTVEGQDFDWSEYDGKVVLIDFWATWCGPCRAELPNVLENYEKYHDKGFEVVGISLDENREELESFLEEEKIPWVTLFSEAEEATGWKHPLATYYGVNAIPTVILVDQEGKVVSLSARGPILSATLARLLGPADAEADEDADDS